jgi:hypothetical protein
MICCASLRLMRVQKQKTISHSLFGCWWGVTLCLTCAVAKFAFFCPCNIYKLLITGKSTKYLVFMAAMSKGL